MGKFDKELEGIKDPKERRKEYKRLHTAESRVEGKKTWSNHCEVTKRLEPTPKQVEFLRYYANCSTLLYKLMVAIWKDHGSPPRFKRDFWKQCRAEINFSKERPEYEIFAKCPSYILAWVYNELWLSQTRQGGLEGNVMKDWFGLEWSKSHLHIKDIRIIGMGSSEWIKMPDGPVKPDGVVKSAKVFLKDENWYITFSIDPRVPTPITDTDKKKNAEAWKQKTSASKAWFHRYTEESSSSLNSLEQKIAILDQFVNQK